MASAVERTAAQIAQLKPVTSQVHEESKGAGGSISSAITKVFTSGLGLVPLIGGLFGLFGGGGQPEPPPLVKYTMPERISFQAANLVSGIQQSDYDQFGMPRLFSPAPVAASVGPSATTAGAGARGTEAPAPQINVNVHAMDARSFLDHSNEIAQAVRQAMLNLNSINDVMSDL